MKLSVDEPIVIVGAGIGGLSAALALRKFGFQNVKVYDFHSEGREVKGAFHLGANAMQVLAQLGLSKEALGSGVSWKRYEVFWRGEKRLFGYDLEAIKQSGGYAPLTISRRDLEGILRAGLPEGTIFYDKEFISYTQSKSLVEVHFRDGESTEAALLIGADGVNSRIRLQLKGASEYRSDGRVGYEVLLQRTGLEGAFDPHLDQPFTENWGRHGSIAVSRHSEKDLYLFLTLEPSTDGNPMGAFQDRLEYAFGDWPSPLRGLLPAILKADCVYHPIGDRAPEKGWYEGQVVLVGDAIHPMFPYLWQGAAMTLESAWVLAQNLSENPQLKKSLHQYEKQRYARCKKVARTAAANARQHSARLGWTLDLRNFFWRQRQKGWRESQVQRFQAGIFS